MTVSELDLTVDRFLGGRVIVRQPATGYRAGLDAVLLAASLEADKGQTLVEAGCGAGAALLCAASRLEAATFTGFERDPALAAMMERSAIENGFGDRVCAEAGDIAERPRELENRFEQAFANPPFFRPSSIRPPGAGREAAYLADVPLKAWVLFLHHVTRPGGWITVIHRAAALAELLALLNNRCGAIEVLPVRPHAGAPAKRIVVRARKGLRPGEVRLLDGLTLHERAGGELTARAAEVMRGAALEWR